MSLPGYSKHKWSGALVDLLLGDLMVRRQSETAAAKNARLCRQNTRQGGQLHFSVVVHNLRTTIVENVAELFQI